MSEKSVSGNGRDDVEGSWYYNEFLADYYNRQVNFLSYHVDYARTSRALALTVCATMAGTAFYLASNVSVTPLTEQSIDMQIVPECIVEAVTKGDDLDTESQKAQKLKSQKDGFDVIASKRLMKDCLERGEADLVEKHIEEEKHASYWSGGLKLLSGVFLYFAISGVRRDNTQIKLVDAGIDHLKGRRDAAREAYLTELVSELPPETLSRFRRDP